MPNRLNPTALSVLGELEFEGFDRKLKQLITQIEQDDQARDQWLTERRVIEKQLRGTTPRNRPPWQGACELAPPLTKKILRRWIPVLYNLVALANPISHFKSGTAQAANQAPVAEEFFTWLVRDYMDDVLSEVSYLCNGIGAGGQDYLAVCWDYRTELENRVAIAENLFPQGVPQDVSQVAQRLVQEFDITRPSQQVQQQLVQAAQALVQGAHAVKVEYRRVVADKPRITYYDSGRVIVPPRSGQPYEADYVCLVDDYSPSQLRQMALDGILNGEAVNELIGSVGSPEAEEGSTGKRARATDYSLHDEIRRQQLQEAGVDEVEEPDVIRVHKVFCWMDKNGDGIDERVVLWYSPDNKRIVLAVHDFPFSFKMWPVVRFDYEKVAREPYRAQGMGQQLKAIQEQYTKQYRATADAIDIQLAPVFQTRITSNFQARNIKWGPGKIIPVMNVGDIAPVEKSPFNLHEYLQDRGELKRFAEEHVGSIDAALSATGQQLERRTATEVQSLAGQIRAMQGMDASVFQLSMAKVFQIVWEMWLDFGPEEIYFQVTGEQIPKPFTKSQYNYKYQLIPAGTPGNTDRQQQLSDMVQFAQIVMPLAPDVVDRTVFVYQVARLIDPRFANQLLLPPARQQAMSVINQAAAALAKGDVPDVMKALTGTEQGAATT